MIDVLVGALRSLGRRGDAASTTGSVHAKLASLLARGTPISLQYGTIAVTLNSTSNTATITSVDTTKSSVIFLGSSTTETNAPRPNVDGCRVALTNATTVTATRNASGATPCTVSFVVITWSGTTNVQAGSIVIANSTATNTATITSVDVTKTILFWLGQETAEATVGRSAYARLALTNATTITATRDSSAEASTITVGYVAVTF